MKGWGWSKVPQIAANKAAAIAKVKDKLRRYELLSSKNKLKVKCNSQNGRKNLDFWI